MRNAPSHALRRAAVRFPIPFATAALLLLVGGCALTRPPPQVAAAAPLQWHAPLPPGIDAAAPHARAHADPGRWWSAQGDALLAQLIEAAQQASPDLASAAARVAEARAKRVAAGAALAPRLDGSVSATRSNTSSVGAGAGAVTGSAASGSASASAALGAPATIAQAGLQASWEIDLFGGLGAQRDAADAGLAAADARLYGARVAVAAETASAYFAARGCRQQLAVAAADARSRSETARLTDLSAQAGFVAPADAALTRAGAADAAARLTQQRAQCALQRQALVALTAIDAVVLEQKMATAPVEYAAPAIKTIASVPADALAQRPDVYAAERSVASASADVGAARAQRYPRLSLSGSIGRLEFRGGGLAAGLNTWSIGPVALTLPIFDAGTRAANTEAAVARYDAAASQYRATVRQAVREVEQALVQLEGTADRSADTARAVQGFQRSLAATQSRVDAGLASLLDLETARRQLFSAQTAQVALQRERAQAWVSLYRALGGGWERPDANAAAATTGTSPSTAPASARAIPGKT